MIKINPNKLDERNNYKLLSAIVVPRPIAFVTTLNNDLSVNGAPFSFFNVVSGMPPLVSISVLRKNGKLKDTARNIIKNNEYVVHLTTEDNIEKINLSSKELDINESEIDFAKLTLTKSELIKTPAVKDAKIRFEVKLVKHLTFEENNEKTVDLFIGRVLMYHLDESIYKNTYIDFKKLKPIGRLAGNNFITSNGYKEIVRPK